MVGVQRPTMCVGVVCDEWRGATEDTCARCGVWLWGPKRAAAAAWLHMPYMGMGAAYLRQTSPGTSVLVVLYAIWIRCRGSPPE